MWLTLVPFVDIGLHEDGLVHVSKMSTKRVKHPSDVVSVGDIVTVWVYNIDQEKQKGTTNNGQSKLTINK